LDASPPSSPDVPYDDPAKHSQRAVLLSGGACATWPRIMLCRGWRVRGICQFVLVAREENGLYRVVVTQLYECKETDARSWVKLDLAYLTWKPSWGHFRASFARLERRLHRVRDTCPAGARSISSRRRNKTYPLHVLLFFPHHHNPQIRSPIKPRKEKHQRSHRWYDTPPASSLFF
jgi:hypothetical protein